jgi:hydroxyacylglutathione hydrolase
MSLPDAVRVFPAHGAGSACGKNLSTEKQSTIGEQRLFNDACQPMSEPDFVALVTAGQPPAPDYFVYDAILNRKDRAVYDADQPLTALDTTAMLTAIAAGAVVVDARDAQDFAAGYPAGALNVPADGRFAETGMILQPADNVVVMAPDGGAQEVAVRLARIGFDHVIGYLPDGETFLTAQPELTSRGSRLTPRQLAEALSSANAPVVVDVRNGAERDAGFIPGSLHMPLAQLHQRIHEIPIDRPVVTDCAGGWRSRVAASMLRRQGNPDVSDVLGGFTAWTATPTRERLTTSKPVARRD